MIDGLRLPHYNLESYKKKPEQQDDFELGRQVALVGIFKSRFLKRLESSIEAFSISIRRALEFAKTFSEYGVGRDRYEMLCGSVFDVLPTIETQFDTVLLFGFFYHTHRHVELLELTVTIGFCVGLGRAFNVLDIARDFDVNWSREPANPR